VLNILLKLGFSKKEAELYLCLLKHGTLTNSSLSSKVRLNRSTCYLNVQKLIKKNLIISYKNNGIKYFQANPPQHIKHLLQNEEENLFLKQQILNNILPLLKAINNSTQKTISPKISKSS